MIMTSWCFIIGRVQPESFVCWCLCIWLITAIQTHAHTQRPISNSSFNINSCYPIARGRMADILWPRSTPINFSSTIKRVKVAGHTSPASMISTFTWGKVADLKRPMSTTFTTYTITWVTVVGLKRPMSTTLLTQRHFNKFFFITFVVAVITAKGKMDGFVRSRS